MATPARRGGAGGWRRSVAPCQSRSEEHEITKDDKELKFNIKATPDAQVGQHKQLFVQFNLLRDGEPMVNTFAGGGILRVDKASVAQK